MSYNDRPRPRWIPEFPHCKIKWLERILRKIHCFFFKRYYGARIPGFLFGDYKSKPIYIWNARPLNLTDLSGPSIGREPENGLPWKYESRKTNA